MPAFKFIQRKMTSHDIEAICIIIIIMVLLVDVACGFKLISGNQTDTELARVKRQSPDVEDALVYATRTELYKVPYHKITGNRLDRSIFTEIMRESSYLVNAFDVSIKDNIALYGVSSLNAKALGPGSTFLGDHFDKTDLKVKFEHFTVDWLDHNVYVFADRQLRMYRLRASMGQSRSIYNGSQNVRNIEVETRKHFIAWIGNDNNIVRAWKDGSGLTNVFTAPTKIHCMTLDPDSGRFFFYIMSHGKKKKQKPWANQYGPEGPRMPELPTICKQGMGIGQPECKGFEKNDGEDTEPESKRKKRSNPIETENESSHNYAVLYSVDYEGMNEAVRESSIQLKSRKSVPIQVAIMKERVFVVIQDKLSSGDYRHRLVMPDRKGNSKDIVTSDNWMITSMRLVRQINTPKRPCEEELRRYCSMMCIHMTDESLNCICDQYMSCISYLITTPPPPTSPKTTQSPERSGQGGFGANWWMIVLIIVIFLLICIAFYCLYTWCMNDDTDGQAGDQANMVMQPDGTMAPALPYGSKTEETTNTAGTPQFIGPGGPGLLGPDGQPLQQQFGPDGQPLPPEAWTQQQPPPKKKGFFGKFLDLIGLGSDIDENQMQQQQQFGMDPTDPTGQTTETAGAAKRGPPGAPGPQSNFGSSHHSLDLKRIKKKEGTGSLALGSDGGSRVELTAEQKKKRKKRQSLYRDLDKLLDTNRKNKSKRKKDDSEDDDKGSGKKNAKKRKSKSKSKKRSSPPSTEAEFSEDDEKGKDQTEGSTQIVTSSDDEARKGKSKQAKNKGKRSNKKAKDNESDSSESDSSSSADDTKTSQKKKQLKKKKKGKRALTGSDEVSSSEDSSNGMSAKTAKKLNKKKAAAGLTLKGAPTAALGPNQPQGQLAGPGSAIDAHTSGSSLPYKWYDPFGCC